jgi:hypothetical protein
MAANNPMHMAAKVDLRAELTVGRNALHPGRVREISKWILDRPRRIPGLIELMWDDDPGVASRAADVLERITHDPSPAIRRAVQEYKEELIGLLPDAAYAKLRWNLALTLPRLTLTIPECRRIAAVLQSWLDDKSSIIKTAALHGCAQLTRQDPGSLAEVLDLLRVCGRSGTPAMRARSRILLKELEKPGGKKRKRVSTHIFD